LHGTPETSPRTSFNFKIIVVGSYGVGKTSVIRRFAVNQFREEYIATVGTDITKKYVEAGSGPLHPESTLVIWDISGRPRFESIHRPFVMGARAAIVVAAQDDSDSFFGVEGGKFGHIIGVREWIRIVNWDTPIPTILLVNKADLTENLIPDRAIKEVVEETGILGAYPTSYKTGLNIDDVFSTLIGYHSEKFPRD